VSFHSTGFKAVLGTGQSRDGKEYFTEWRLVRRHCSNSTRWEVLVSLLASGACERFPDFNFILGESV